MIRVYAGAQAPEKYTLNLGTSPSVDFSTVTAADLQVRRPDGSTAVWSVAISNQTTTGITLTHTFASNDLPTPGTYSVYAKLTVPSGIVRSRPRPLVVREPFDHS